MYTVIKNAYLSGRYTDEDLELFVSVNYITREKADGLKQIKSLIKE